MLSDRIIRNRLEKKGIIFSEDEVTNLKGFLYFFAELSFKDYLQKNR